MVQNSSRYTRLNSRSGFTLIELMVVISIIGILTLIALPNYQRYVNEARAAEIINRIHSIALAYQDLAASVPDVLKKPVELSSADFGLAPSYLPGLAYQFSPTHNIEFSAQLVNHYGHFQFTGHEAFPVLFLRANEQHGIDILNALDHVTKYDHSFVTPSIMMIALASPYEIHQGTEQINTQPAVATPDQIKGQPTDQVTGQPTDQVTGQPTDQVTGQPTDQITGQPTDQVTGQTTNQNTGQSTVQTPVPSQTAGGTQSTAGDHLNWPPGWVKHPQNHQNQQHGHNN
ncbi:prepilin-type N-terminal cleavage/methylation domain-containing protein [Pseudoalteromonas pernae]|uniref:prepilin-type N-terminal cleavage/methylation domain-containing protein n=1 Tax=Pseudoalteromonas pernae TaxID=3118054 RepID=UPI0032420C40